MAKILLVEDDDLLRKALLTWLTKKTYEVVVARHGEEAIQLVKLGVDFDLMLTDILMPEKEGLATIVAIRAMLPRIKVVAMSGGLPRMNAEVFLKMAQKVGANRLLAKPFSHQELDTAIEEAMGSQ